MDAHIELTEGERRILAPLVVPIAKHILYMFQGRLHRQEKADLISVGLLTACRRLRDYDPTRGASLLTFLKDMAYGEARHEAFRRCRVLSREISCAPMEDESWMSKT